MSKILFWIVGTIVSLSSVKAQLNISDSLEHQSLQRKYIVHLPPDYSPDIQYPLVMVLHGGSGNYQSVQGFTQMNPVSNQNNFLAVYPQGIGVAPPGYSWADGRNTSADQAGIDDVGFISKLVDTLTVEYTIDTTRIYVCGFSNGGFMTQRLACEVPELFAALGGLGCSMDIALIQNCSPGQAVPMAYFAGTSDPEVPYAGGAMNNPEVTPIVPVDTAVQFWVDNNYCQTAEPLVNIPNTVESDNSTVEFYKYSDCDCNAEVHFYKILNGGHTWPGVPIPQFPQLGNTNEDIHASFELWDFFDQHALCTTIVDLRDTEDDYRVAVFPNPAKEVLHIDSPKRVRSIKLYNSVGKEVMNEKASTLNIETLPSGIYILLIQFDRGKRRTFKVMRE